MALKKPRSLAPVPLLWTRQSWIPQVMFMGHHDPWGWFNGCPCGAVTWPIYIYIHISLYKCGYLHRMGWHTINSIVNGHEWRHFEWFTRRLWNRLNYKWDRKLYHQYFRWIFTSSFTRDLKLDQLPKLE